MSGARAFPIRGGGLAVEVLDIGASLRTVLLDGIDRSLTLGLADLAQYPEHSPHLGAIAGRVGNRIAGAAFELGGVTVSGDRNLDGRHMLHGGKAGFGNQRWTMTGRTDNAVSLRLESPDGDSGFPGNVTVTCTYTCEDDGQLRIALEATTDALTVINLATHAYFNLDGESVIDHHRLTLEADRWTPLDAELIPTGKVDPVHGELDFRAERVIGATAHDQNYCLADERRATPAFAARLRAGGVALEVHTTEPGLQLYTGDNLGQSVIGLHGRVDAPRAGVCLESQAWPDAVHHPGFPSIELRPGERYRHVTLYRFSRE